MNIPGIRESVLDALYNQCVNEAIDSERFEMLASDLTQLIIMWCSCIAKENKMENEIDYCLHPGETMGDFVARMPDSWLDAQQKTLAFVHNALKIEGADPLLDAISSELEHRRVHGKVSNNPA